MTAIFSWLLLCVPIYVLRVPADDSKPHILPIQTIDGCGDVFIAKLKDPEIGIRDRVTDVALHDASIGR